MYRKYYSFNDMPQPVRHQQNSEPKPQVPAVCDEQSKPAVKNDGLLSKFEKDDLILAAVLLALIMDDCEDKLLIAAIGALLLF